MFISKSNLGSGLLLFAIATTGCIESQPISQRKPFESNELDACLAIVVDMSGSFASSWDDKAYKLFLELMDQYFTEGTGVESRIVICQLSANDNVVLFEGRPEGLRSQFRSPEELNAFLKQHSDPTGSSVYQATEKTIRYLSSMPGVTDKTRLMTVMLSDMSDSGRSPAIGQKMLATLRQYQEQGGGLALYYVHPGEISRWNKILRKAGFQPGTYVIESTLVAHPQLPHFN